MSPVFRHGKLRLYLLKLLDEGVAKAAHAGESK